MAKVLNYTKYHKINVADHSHHHRRRRQQQQQEQQQQLQQQQQEQIEQPTQQQLSQQKLQLIKQQQKQRQTQITTNQSNNDNNNKHSHFNYNNSSSNNNNNEFINYRTLQQHVANDQPTHFHINNANFQQLTSVSSFSILKNRNSKINKSHNVNSNKTNNKTFMHSLGPPTKTTITTPPSLSSPLPPSTTCSSYSSTPSSSLTTSPTCSTVAFNSSTLSIPSTTPLSSSYLNLSNNTYSTYYSTCCVLTYNMFTAYAEAATLQLKRKTQFNKLLHVSGHPDMRSICYLILMAFFYWGVMIRAAVATNITTTTQTPPSTTTTSHVAELNTKTMFYSNLTAETTTIPHNSSIGIRAVHGEGGDPPLPLLGNSSLKLPISLLTSDDTLTNYQRRLLMRREAANVPDFDEDDSSYHDDELDEYEILINNKSALGKYIGAPCNNSKCESTLLHVVCEKDTNTCGCEKNYPVQLGLTRGCDKPKKLGEQCFYDETCQYNDENSLCVQVRHNAMCQCAGGFHSVSYTKPTRRVFCTQDIDELNSDLPTLLGVCIGIGVLAGLICMVLHLFSKTKYPRHRNFGDANLPPPIMYSSETVQSGRPSSRSSIRSSGGSIGSYGNRRSSTGGVGGNNSATAGSKGILVSTSRTGSRRPSLASVHSTSSSVRSYSMMRFEKEQQQKEIRQEMKLRLARLQQHQHQQQHQQHLREYKPQIIIGDTAVSMQHGVALSRITMATPSPITPNSTDELLPAVDESQEYLPKSDIITKPPYAESVASATISAIKNVAASSGTNQNMTSTTNAAAIASTSTSATGMDLASAAAYIGPCSSSNEAL
ncbi:uncharacterized protein LOC111677099 isoform X2 [Lucilia cuprina]|uniref:uncharacterized protein LOC111677099 isoform X2 n=1 Tax=Lucilia cuprina TaxID=7375 RepID=UPI001F063026|nr:uncharacterized protein LOC111677099 isoform X2 [Lucilia cuprina]